MGGADFCRVVFRNWDRALLQLSQARLPLGNVVWLVFFELFLLFKKKYLANSSAAICRVALKVSVAQHIAAECFLVSARSRSGLTAC